MTSLHAVPHSLPPLARSLARSLARGALLLPLLPARSLAARPRSSRPGRLAPRLPAGPPGLSRGGGPAVASRAGRGPSPEPRGPDARGRPSGPTERRRHRRAPARGPRSVAARPQGRRTCHPRRRSRDAPARASPPARLGASRSFLGPRPPRLLGALPLPSCLSSLLFLSPQPPCLCSRWEGLGLPEVPGMGPGPIGCSWTRPLRGEGALAVSSSLGEGTIAWVGGGLLRERPRVWG